MLIVRVHVEGDALPAYGRVLPDAPDEVELLSDNPYYPLHGAGHPVGRRVPFMPADWQKKPEMGPVRLLCPVVPSKIVGVGSNYHDHTVEMGKPIPQEPVIFMKPPSALIDPGKPIVRPPGYERVDYEGELAVVIGKRMHRVAPGEVAAHLLGYMALNDVTVRDLQKKDGQFTRAKGFDTFCPVGPAICTDVEVALGAPVPLRTRKNGQVVQDAARDRLLFSVPDLVSFISGVMTLLPGDVITTGTPAGVGNLVPGDLIEIDIAGLPPLRCPVIG